jgi:hypothetical protein
MTGYTLTANQHFDLPALMKECLEAGKWQNLV